MQITHDYYITPTVDADKMVQDAKSKVNSHKKSSTENTLIAIIHYHNFGSVCNDMCLEIQ